MAKAEADAAEAKKCETDAAVRAAELEKECAEAQHEIELLRERGATAELAAEAEVAFAALEAGEEAKMEAAEALAQARAEALTARGELDALRESLRVSPRWKARAGAGRRAGAALAHGHAAGQRVRRAAQVVRVAHAPSWRHRRPDDGRRYGERERRRGRQGGVPD